ncbi:MAG: elongation factor P maturation arginine rhamnosyltransferase EarP [Aquabacterium sp.]|nr:elongation factor P maturation arginine rhamnosyltransferase EarP [Aquabacterium sp.]
MQALLWDVFCRVIDNHGDLGVCWRLAADLAARGQAVRLWVDDARALAWMAPQGCDGVTLMPWPQDDDATLAATGWPEPGDVVVEAFGCDPPAGFVARMRRPAPPAWINLEYLSAEGYVERSHGLPSPVMSGPGRGLVKRFFYPGFTPRTGGLLREADLPAQQAAFDAAGWLAAQGVDHRAGERIVTLFCYPHAPVAELLRGLSECPTLLLSTPGPATAAVDAAARSGALPASVRVHRLPWLTQPGYDQLLWSADFNIVRGEDSFVRAMWAGKPFLWHIYRQDDGAHAVKLDAFLQLFLQERPDDGAQQVRRAWRAFNDTGEPPQALADGLGELLDAAAQAHAGRWRSALMAQADLVSQLLAFVRAGC